MESKCFCSCPFVFVSVLSLPFLFSILTLRKEYFEKFLVLKYLFCFLWFWLCRLSYRMFQIHYDKYESNLTKYTKAICLFILTAHFELQRGMAIKPLSINVLRSVATFFTQKSWSDRPIQHIWLLIFTRGWPPPLQKTTIFWRLPGTHTLLAALSHGTIWNAGELFRTCGTKEGLCHGYNNNYSYMDRSEDAGKYKKRRTQMAL